MKKKSKAVKEVRPVLKVVASCGGSGCAAHDEILPRLIKTKLNRAA